MLGQFGLGSKIFDESRDNFAGLPRLRINLIEALLGKILLVDRDLQMTLDFRCGRHRNEPELYKFLIRMSDQSFGNIRHY